MRTVFPVSVNFSAGEEPTHTKLNGLSGQTKSGLTLMEYAIGDLWGQSGDTLTNNPSGRLLIPNLARYIGRSSNLNSYTPSISGIKYTYSVTASSLHEFSLPYPATVSTGVWSGTGAPTGSAQTNKSDVISANQWWLDSNGINLYTYDASQVDWKFTYTTSIAADFSSAQNSFNLIPDSGSPTWAFHSLKIEYLNGIDKTLGYKIFLPPRGPLSHNGWRTPENISQNISNTPNSGDKLVWQSDSQPASTIVPWSAHYRYYLPIWAYPGLGDNQTIPIGTMYLYDELGTGTIIEGCAFKAGTGTDYNVYTFYATGTNLDNWLTGPIGSAIYSDAMLKSSSHANTYYPTGGLKLITCSLSISEALSSLKNLFYSHDHNSGPTSKQLSHSKLYGLIYSGSSPQLTASTYLNDDHPQYLERHGYNSSRDQYNNALLGDLLLASTNAGTYYENLLDNSRKLFLGAAGGGGSSPGLKLFWEYATDRVVAEVSSNSSTNRGLLIRDKTSPTVNYLDINVGAANGIDISSPDPINITSLSGGTSTLTLDNGIVTTNGYYALTSRSSWITVPLCTSAQIIDLTGTTREYWKQSVGGFYTYSGTSFPANLHAYISDWPNGMTLSKVQVFWLETSNYITVNVFKETLPIAPGAYTSSSSIVSGGSAITPSTGGTSESYEVNIDTGAGTFDRHSHVLSIHFSTTNSSVIIYPFVRLYATYATVSPWW